jgi:hypothetical protein
LILVIQKKWSNVIKKDSDWYFIVNLFPCIIELLLWKLCEVNQYQKAFPHKEGFEII